MSKLDNRFERAVLWLVTDVPGSFVSALALLLYPGVGLIVPLVLHWSTLFLVEANVLGVLFAGILALGWLTLQVGAAKRRYLVEWTTNLRLLNSEEFEWLVGELYRREVGWERVRETGHQDRPDGNIDLRSIHDGQHKIIQCKRWGARRVGVDEVREFAGTLLREGLPGNAGVFVTLSDFTEQARAEAKKIGLTLVNGRGLYARMEGARRPKPCPVCRAPMLFSLSPHGWWFRCVAPGCPGKSDVGDDPGRAVEFLTQRPARAPR